MKDKFLHLKDVADSVSQAIDQLAQKDMKDDAGILKQAISAVAQAAELLLKERLEEASTHHELTVRKYKRPFKSAFDPDIQRMAEEIAKTEYERTGNFLKKKKVAALIKTLDDRMIPLNEASYIRRFKVTWGTRTPSKKKNH